MKISAQQLEDFASRSPAQRLLPELVRRLIRATADSIEDVFFPSGESTFRPGADGVLRAQGKPPYVPAGVSVWELSTEKDPPKKGRRDFEKRSKPDACDRYLDVDRSQVTFVALSMRRWHTDGGLDRDGFECVQRARGVWKDVKIFDADHLEDWLDHSPTVRAWLAREMAIASVDMKSIEAFWDDYRHGISPRMSERLLLLNRDADAERTIQSAVRGEVFRVKADSPHEAAAFVAASVLMLPEEAPHRAALLAKGVVITKPESEAYLTDSDQKLFVVVLGRAIDLASRLAARGHTVAVAYGSSHTARGNNSALIDLRRPKRHEFVQALQDMGLHESEARTTAGKCHCSITVLYRIRDLAHSRRPDWATPQQLSRLLGPLLCGAWMHLSAADGEIVAELAGSPYEQVEQGIRDVLYLDDSPVRREGDLTALSAPADLWQIGIEHRVITRAHLGRFRDAAITVLGERDPALDLPADRRAYARIEGKGMKYSSSLRRGIVEVLRLIAINAENLTYVDRSFSAQHFADGVVQDLPGLALDYQTLASLDSLLPDLAEAAPLPFLSALETLTGGDSAKLAPIFEGSDNPVFGRTFYLGTLRGLEVLAWDPAYFVRATRLLALLAEIDPGGRLNNRPINSLARIFLPWAPHTNVSHTARHRALEKLCAGFPSIAWTLLAKLLPEQQGISFGTAEPKWRESGSSQRPDTTYQSEACDHEFVVQIATPLAGTDPTRWIKLIKAVASIKNEAQLDALLAEIDCKRSTFVAEGQDTSLWDALSALVAKHRAYASAGWAMPVAMVDKINATTARFEPSDPVDLYRHLFDATLLERMDPKETSEQRRARGQGQRDDAVAKIVLQGAEALIKLSRQAKAPGLLAPSIVRTGSPETVAAFVLSTFDGDDRIAWLSSLVSGIGVSRFGLSWGQGLVENAERRGATSVQLAALLRAWDDTHALLNLVASKSAEVQSAYWTSRDAFVRSDDEALVAEAVERMMEHGRSVDLIPFVGGRLEQSESTALVRLLAGALEEVIAQPERAQHIDRYWLGEIFEALRARADVGLEELGALEYHWFPALHAYGAAREFALHDHMAENPEFFVQVLSDLYRADDEIKDDEGGAVDQPDESDESDAEANLRAKAEIAYKLLDSWRRLPWLNAESGLGCQSMLSWAQEVLRRASQVGRVGVAAREIGKLLACSPDDSDDNMWPHRVARDFIEALANDEMESAIVIELFNKRGAHTRSADGGGESERARALIADGWADQLQDQWPRTAHVLRESAKDWLLHAQWEDRQAAEKRISL
ncbi:hypothetical protein DFR29_104113 [Tahibacter aquaticus]|uniref:Uncharacterized protein n=1 Tax=Tahibacter aquaticus TaxID=520092 RepID=A0A4R6Z262_9GAMM|nr:hypothetical protein [Tahibacter aquaticus]TDR45685.1 hypothetical protein DFR29_104113 [Tahibacter aquaticus]